MLKVTSASPFLSVVGWRFVTLRVTSVGEAASIDVALVLDRSSSMANLIVFEHVHVPAATE
jgi:hypothetical protein